MYGYFQASVLSGQFIRLHLFSVQIIMNCDFPWHFFGFQVPLVEKITCGSRRGNRISLFGQFLIRGKIFYGIVFSVIHNIRFLFQPEGIDHINAVHTSVLVQVHIYVFIFRYIRTCCHRGKPAAEQHGRRQNTGCALYCKVSIFFHSHSSLSAALPISAISFSFLKKSQCRVVRLITLSKRINRVGRTKITKTKDSAAPRPISIPS